MLLRILPHHTVQFKDDADEGPGDLLRMATATARPSLSLDCIEDVGVQIIAEDGHAIMAAVSFLDAHRIAAWIRENVPAPSKETA